MIDKIYLEITNICNLDCSFCHKTKRNKKLMSEDEIKALLTEKFADVIATKNKGMIMKTVMAELKGKADGKVINAVVAQLCE